MLLVGYDTLGKVMQVLVLKVCYTTPNKENYVFTVLRQARLNTECSLALYYTQDVIRIPGCTSYTLSHIHYYGWKFSSQFCTWYVTGKVLVIMKLPAVCIRSSFSFPGNYGS